MHNHGERERKTTGKMKRDNTDSIRMRNDLFHFLLAVMILPVSCLHNTGKARERDKYEYENSFHFVLVPSR